MSENPTPPAQNPAPASTTATASPVAAAVTSLERAGTGLTVVGVIVTAVPLLFLAFASNIKISTLSGVNTVATTGLILTIAALALTLVATVLNVFGIGKPRLGPGLSTFFSGAGLITIALFLFVTVLPRVSALNDLNNNIVPFGKSLNANCKNPLNAIKNDYQKAQEDANPIALDVANGATPAAETTDLAAYVTAAMADITTFQKDLSNFTTYQANLNKLTAPDSKYAELLDLCQRDVNNTVTFLNGANGFSSTDLVNTLDAAIAVFSPSAALTAGLEGTVSAAVPRYYNAISLLQDSAKAASAQFPFTLPPGIPAAQVPTVTVQMGFLFALGYPSAVAAAMGSASTSTDIPLQNDGNQLVNDIENTLTTNLAPFNVDAAAIVNAAS